MSCDKKMSFEECELAILTFCCRFDRTKEAVEKK